MKKVLLCLLLIASNHVLADSQNEKSFFVAATKGNVEKIQKLLDNRRVAVDSRDEKGWSALHFAAYHEQIEVIDVLLGYGVSIDLMDDKGRSPLFVAAQNGLIAVVRALLDRGANCTLRNSEGKTPIASAAENGCSVVVGILYAHAEKGKSTHRLDAQSAGAAKIKETTEAEVDDDAIDLYRSRRSSKSGSFAARRAGRVFGLY